MGLLYVCEGEEKELRRQQAPGTCPHCGGKVEAVDYGSRWRFCFVSVCYIPKRKYVCTRCSKRLVFMYS